MALPICIKPTGNSAHLSANLLAKCVFYLFLTKKFNNFSLFIQINCYPAYDLLFKEQDHERTTKYQPRSLCPRRT